MNSGETESNIEEDVKSMKNEKFENQCENSFAKHQVEEVITLQLHHDKINFFIALPVVL